MPECKSLFLSLIVVCAVTVRLSFSQGYENTESPDLKDEPEVDTVQTRESQAVEVLPENKKDDPDSVYFIEYITHPILKIVTWPIEKFVVPALELAFYPVKPPLRYALKNDVLGRGKKMISMGKKDQIMIYPIVVITTGTGSLTGLTYRHSSLFNGFGERFVGQYNLYVNGDQKVRLRLYTVNYFDSKLRVKYDFLYNLRKNLTVAQPNSSFEGSYSDTTVGGGVELAHPLFGKVNGLLISNYRYLNYANTVFQSQEFRCNDGYFFSGFNCLEMRGIGQKFSVVQLGLGIERNTINNENIPTAGSRFSAKWLYHLTDNGHDFHEWGVKLNKYFFLGVERYEISESEQEEMGNPSFEKIKSTLRYRNLKKQIFNRKVIATQLVVSQFHEVEGQSAPIYALRAIGNITPLRGYNGSPFRDYAMVAFSTEYRFPIMLLVEGTIFNEYGVVGRSIHRLEPGDIKNSWGLGMRFSQTDMFLFRSQIGFHGSHMVPVFNVTMDTVF